MCTFGLPRAIDNNPLEIIFIGPKCVTVMKMRGNRCGIPGKLLCLPEVSVRTYREPKWWVSTITYHTIFVSLF